MAKAVRPLLVALGLSLAAPAFAQPADMPFGAVPSVSADDLGAIAGKTDLTMVVNANNSSEVSNNSVSGTSVTGTINFDGAAFSDLRGLSVLSANTGNNVAINASLNVNIALRP